MTTSGVGGYSLQEVKNAPKPNVRFLTERLIPNEGLTIFAGETGIGKSHLMLSIICAMASGEAALGCLHTEQAKVQVFTEDDLTVLQPYVARISQNYGNLNGMEVNFQPEVFQDWVFRQKVEAYRPDVVFIDPIMMLSSIRNENDNSQVKEYLYGLKEFANGLGVSMVFTRHLRKPDPKEKASSDEIFNRVLGAQAWRSVPYHRLIMWRDTNGEYRLTSYSKYDAAFDWVLLFDKNNGKLTIDPSMGSGQGKMSEYRKPITDVMSKYHMQWFRPAVVFELIANEHHMDRNKMVRDSLRSEMRKMVDKGILITQKNGTYVEYKWAEGIKEIIETDAAMYPSPTDIGDHEE